MTEVLAQLRSALAQRYRLERELGRGGMATVYLAEDLKHGRQVAVKVLRPELAAAIGAQRFLNEIRISASLQHPHILTLIDSGELGGFLYYVMPYVSGESLREKLSSDQLPMFRTLGTPAADKRLAVLDSGHVPPWNEVIRETLDWLDRYLGLVE